MTRRVTLKTGLTPQETRERLRAAIDPPLLIWGRKPVQGSVGQWTAGLSRRLMVHNAFQTRLSLVLEPEDEGAGRGVILHGAFGIGVFAKIVLIFMGAAVLTAALTIHEQQGAASIVPWVVAGGGVVAVGVVYGVGRALGQGDVDFLVQFLVRTLNARVIATLHDD